MGFVIFPAGSGKVKIDFPQIGRAVIANAFNAIGDQKGSHGGRPVIILHLQGYFHRWTNGKENWNGVAKANVLGSLSNVKTDLGLAATCILAIDLNNSVFEGEARKVGQQR